MILGKRRILLCLALLIASFAFHIPGVRLGLPSEFSTEIDSPAPLGPLRFVAIRDGGSSEIQYPAGGYIVFLPLQMATLAWHKISGSLGQISAEYPFGFSKPTSAVSSLILSARLTSVIFAAACVAVLAFFLFYWYGRQNTTWILVGAGTSAVFCYYARSANTDMPQTFFWTTGFLLLVDAVRKDFRHTRKRLALSAVLIAFSAAIKDQGVALAIGASLSTFLLAPPNHRLRTTVEYGLILAVGYVLFAIAPDPGRWIAHIRWIGSAGELLQETGPNSHVKDATLRGQLSLFGTILKMIWKTGTPLVTLISALGYLYLLWIRKWRTLLTITIPVLVYYVMFFARVRVAHERYVLFLLPITAILAAEATAALRHLGSHRISRSISGVLLGTALLWSVFLEYGPITYTMIHSTKDRLHPFLGNELSAGTPVAWRGSSNAFPPADVYKEYELWIPPEYRTSFDNQRFHAQVDTSGPPPLWVLSDHSLLNPSELRLAIPGMVIQDSVHTGALRELAVLKQSPFVEARSSVYEDAEKAETFRVSPRYYLYKRIQP